MPFILSSIISKFRESAYKNFFTNKGNQYMTVFLMQLGVNLSNGVTDTLESISILIYFGPMKGIYTQRRAFMIKLNWGVT